MPTTSLGIRYPVLSDTANVPRDLGYTAADVNGLLVAERAAWTTYTPALTATTTNPNIGSTGTISGRYLVIGKTLRGLSVAITLGGTGVSGGSGTWRISLPAGITLNHVGAQVGSARVVAGNYVLGIVGRPSTTLLDISIPSAAGSNALNDLGSTGVWGTAWAAGHSITLTLFPVELA